MFLSQLSVVFFIIFGYFWRIRPSKTYDESTVCVGFLCSVAAYFYPHQDFEQASSFKTSSLFFIGWSLRDRKVTIVLQLAQKWNLSIKI